MWQCSRVWIFTFSPRICSHGCGIINYGLTGPHFSRSTGFAERAEDVFLLKCNKLVSSCSGLTHILHATATNSQQEELRVCQEDQGEGGGIADCTAKLFLRQWSSWARKMSHIKLKGWGGFWNVNMRVHIWKRKSRLYSMFTKDWTGIWHHPPLFDLL